MRILGLTQLFKGRKNVPAKRPRKRAASSAEHKTPTQRLLRLETLESREFLAADWAVGAAETASVAEAQLQFSINGEELCVPVDYADGSVFNAVTLNVEWATQFVWTANLPDYAITVDGEAVGENETYSFKLDTLDADTKIAVSTMKDNIVKTFYINTLNSDLPTLTTTGESKTRGDIYLSFVENRSIVKTDASGKIMYYRSEGADSENEGLWDFKSHVINGTLYYSYHETEKSANDLTFGERTPGRRIIMDEYYNVVDAVECVPNEKNGQNVGLDGHDFIMLDLGRYITLSYVQTTVANVPSRDGASSVVVAAYVQEVETTNGVRTVVKDWLSADDAELYQYSVTDANADANDFANVDPAKIVDYVRLNALQLDADGNLLLSCRHMNALIALDWSADTPTRSWILADTNAETFSGQHYLVDLGDGWFSIFNNNNANSSVADGKTSAIRFHRAADGSMENVTEWIVPSVSNSHYSGDYGSFQILDGANGARYGAASWGWNLSGGELFTEFRLNENGGELASSDITFEISTDASEMISGKNAAYRVVKGAAREDASTVVTTANDVVNPYDGLISLREAVQYADDGDAITFAASLDKKNIMVASEIVLDKAITIFGSGRANGTTIRGAGSNRIFRVAAGTNAVPVVIQNATLTNGVASDGGAIRVDAGFALNVVDVSFDGNRSTSEKAGGGAIRLAPKACVKVDVSYFTSNAAAGFGGAIYNESGTLVVENSFFTSNYATNAGGAIRQSDGTTTILGSTFDANGKTSGSVPVVPTDFGGAIDAWRGILTVSGATFVNNAAKTRGGAISIEYAGVNVASTVFETNESTFDGNGGEVATGGAIAVSGTANLVGINFGGNSALGTGGAVAVIGGTTTIDDCFLTSNWSKSGSGGALAVVGSSELFATANVKNSTLSSNAALVSGGGIYRFSNASLTIDACEISNNSAGAGGGLDVYGNAATTKATISNSKIIDNTATSEAAEQSSPLGVGGGIRGNLTEIKIYHSLIADNEASRTYNGDVVGFGGGVYMTNGSDLTLVGCTVAKNKANGIGGGLYLTETVRLTASNSIIATNTAKNLAGLPATEGGDGADVCADLSVVRNGANNLSAFAEWSATSTNNLVYDATKPLFNDAANGDYSLAPGSQAIDAGSDALALAADGSPQNVDLAGKGRKFGTVDVGAYERGNESTATVVTTLDDVVNDHDGVISIREAIENAAPGATISFAVATNVPKITLASPIVLNKNLTIDGRNAAPGYSGTLTLDGGCVWTNGVSNNVGVRIFEIVAETNATIKNVDLQNAFSAKSGGAILNTGTLTLENVELTGNTSSVNGGAIANLNGSLTILGLARATRLANNVAQNGGAIYSFGENATVSIVGTSANKTQIVGNQASGAGGAVAIRSGAFDANFAVFDSNKSNKNSTEYVAGAGPGGALYNAGTAIVFNSSFVCNEAKNADGGAISNAGTLTIESSLIGGSAANKNVAEFGGGVVNAGDLIFSGDSTVSFNVATKNGGGIANTNDGGAIVFGSIDVQGKATLAQNVAGYFGGGLISVAGTSVAVATGTQLVFDANVASQYSASSDAALYGATWPESGIAGTNLNIYDYSPKSIALTVSNDCAFLVSNASDESLRYVYSFEIDGTTRTFVSSSILSPAQLDIPAGSYVGTVELTDSNGNSLGFGATPATLDVRSAPAAFEIAATTFANGRALRLQIDAAPTTGAVDEWKISWGDGTETTRREFSKSLVAAKYYAEPGEYPVSLTAAGTTFDLGTFVVVELAKPTRLATSNLAVEETVETSLVESAASAEKAERVFTSDATGTGTTTTFVRRSTSELAPSTQAQKRRVVREEAFAQVADLNPAVETTFDNWATAFSQNERAFDLESDDFFDDFFVDELTNDELKTSLK